MSKMRKKDYNTLNPNALMKYGIAEPVRTTLLEEPSPDYITQEQIDRALKQSAEKRFKWYVVLSTSTFKKFDTKEELEEYLNAGADTPSLVFFGELQHVVNKLTVE